MKLYFPHLCQLKNKTSILKWFQIYYLICPKASLKSQRKTPTKLCAMLFPVQNWWLKAKLGPQPRTHQDPANPSCGGVTWHCSASPSSLPQNPTQGIAPGLMKQGNSSVILKKENKNDRSPLATSLLRFLPGLVTPCQSRKIERKPVSEGLVYERTSVNECSSRTWQIYVRNRGEMPFKGARAKLGYLKCHKVGRCI